MLRPTSLRLREVLGAFEFVPAAVGVVVVYDVALSVAVLCLDRLYIANISVVEDGAVGILTHEHWTLL